MAYDQSGKCPPHYNVEGVRSIICPKRQDESKDENGGWQSLQFKVGFEP